MTATGVFYDDSRKNWVVEYDYRPDRQSHFFSEEGAIKCATRNGWVEPKGDVLTALRAEVQALRDADEGDCFFYAMEGVYDTILDLIDKHLAGGE